MTTTSALQRELERLPTRGSGRSGTVTVIYGVLAGVVGLLLLWPALGMLSHGLWQDEISTVNDYISGGPSTILFADYRLNNHVLFSLLSWVAIEVAGASETVYRLPSLLPALAAVLVLATWVHRRFGMPAAMLTLLALAASPFHTELMPQARGYGLAYLWVALMVVLGYRLTRRSDTRTLVAFAAVGAGAALTLPVLAISFAAVTLCLVALRWRDGRAARRIFTAAVAAGTATVFVALPFLLSIHRSARSVKGGAPLEWHSAVTFWLDREFAPVVRTLLFGWRDGYDAARLGAGTVILVVLGLVAAGLVAAALVRAGRAERWRLTAVTLAPFLLLYGAVTLLGTNATYRYVAHLFVFLLPLLAGGVVASVRMIASALGHERHAEAVTHAAVVGMTMIALLGLAKLGVYYVNTPMEANRDVGRVVNQTAPDLPVFSNSVRPIVLRQYVQRPIELISNEDVESLCAREGSFVFIHHPYNVGRADTACLDDRGLARFHFGQRRGALMQVWLVDSEP